MNLQLLLSIFKSNLNHFNLLTLSAQKSVQSQFVYETMRQILFIFYVIREAYKYSIQIVMQRLIDKQQVQETLINQTNNQLNKYDYSPINFNIIFNPIIDPQISQSQQQKINPMISQQNIQSQQYTKYAKNNPQIHHTYNRKQKSLSKLTKKFIQKFQGSNLSILILDQITNQMNVQRRRIYDIINIMESLGVVQKIKKNIYQWKGLKQALKIINIYSQGQQYISIENGKQKPKKQKSLQSLSTQFLKYFSKNKQILTLQQISNYIINQYNLTLKKNKIRRLYDIVNIFKCLGLIKKIKITGNKTTYQWLGCKNLIKITNNQSLIHNHTNANEQLYDINSDLIQTSTKTNNHTNNNFNINQSSAPCNYSQPSNSEMNKENKIKNLQQIKKTQLQNKKQKSNQTIKTRKMFTSMKINNKQKCNSLQNQIQVSKSEYSTHMNKHHPSTNSKKQKQSHSPQQPNNPQTPPHFKPTHLKPSKYLSHPQTNDPTQSYFTSIICKYKQNGVNSLDQIINKFDEHLWNSININNQNNQCILNNLNQS